MKLISILAFFSLVSCSGFRFDMDMDLDIAKNQQRVKSTKILPSYIGDISMEGAKAAIDQSQVK